ncbi:MAG TPA: hypothetical protein VFC02_06185, partial [Anaerolineales bacterium]|nr:hypothetical protein [Anaerolineales bacterium]
NHQPHGNLQPKMEPLLHESHILAWRFTKRQVGMPDESWFFRVSGNCCHKGNEENNGNKNKFFS